MGLFSRLRRYGDWRDFALPTNKIDEAVPGLPSADGSWNENNLGRGLFRRIIKSGPGIGAVSALSEAITGKPESWLPWAGETSDMATAGFVEGGIGPILGLAETAGLAPDGSRQNLRQGFEDTRDQYLAQDPSLLRAGVAAGSELSGNVVPLTPGGAIGSTVARKMGGGLFARMAGASAAGAAEGGLAAFGDSAGMEWDERLKATAMGTGLGTLMGGLGGSIGARSVDAVPGGRVSGELVDPARGIDVMDQVQWSQRSDLPLDPRGRRLPESQLRPIERSPDDWEAPYQSSDTRFDISDEAKQLMRDEQYTYRDEIAAQRRPTQKWSVYDDPQGLIDKVKMTEEDFVSLKPGTALNNEQLAVATNYFSHNIKQRDALRAQARENPGDFQLQSALEHYEKRALDLWRVSDAALGESGRTLQSSQALQAAFGDEGSILRMIRREYGQLKPADEKALAAIDLKDPEALRKVVLNIAKPKWGDWIRGVFYQSVLSGIDTIERNLTGGTYALTHLPIMVGRGLIDKTASALVPGRKRQYYTREAAPALVGAYRGALDGIQVAANILRKGTQGQDFKLGSGHELTPRNVKTSPLDQFTGGSIPRSSWDWLSEAGSSKLSRGTGVVMGAPFRALAAPDAFFRSMTSRAELHAGAIRQAINEGLTGKAQSARVAELIQDPTSKMIQAAKKAEEIYTFTDEPGTIAAAFQNLVEKSKAGWVVMPFIRTGSSLFRAGFEFTPAGFVMSSRTGGKRAFQGDPEMLAKGLMGSTAMGAMWLGLQSGAIEVTGPVPVDSRDRDMFYNQDKTPYTLTVGDVNIPLGMVEPLSTPLAILSSIHNDLLKGEGDETSLNERTLKATMNLMRNQLDRSYMEGLANFMDIIGGGENKVNALKRFAHRTVGAFQPFSGLTTGQAEYMDPGIKETNSLTDYLKTQLPGLRNEVPNRVNTWGEDIVGPKWRGYLASGTPLAASRVTKDNLEDVLQELDVYPSKKKTFRGETLEDPEMSREMQRISGNLVRARLDRIVEAPGFQRLPPERQRVIVQREIGRAKSRAEQIFARAHPEMRRRR